MGMVIGLPLLGLATTLAVLGNPAWLRTVLTLDLWLLGYHHVLATFTRTALDSDSFRRYWALNLLAPVLIFVALLASAIASPSAALWITTLYLHWQLFHYVRQSEGITKAYAGRGGRRPAIVNDPVSRAAFYIVPATCFLTMAARGQTQFLGYPVWLPQLSQDALIACWIATLLLCVAAGVRVLRSFKAGELTPQHLAFLLSHYLVFVMAYAGIRDIVLSWLMANIWHNGQYLAFVWIQNRNRFNDSVDNRHRLLSTLCQSKNVHLYVGFCLTLTLATYSVAGWIQEPLKQATGLSELTLLVVVYQAINFHHYVIDAVIWRRPKAKAAMMPATQAG
jgi:hypothetical protein